MPCLQACGRPSTRQMCLKRPFARANTNTFCTSGTSRRQRCVRWLRLLHLLTLVCGSAHTCLSCITACGVAWRHNCLSCLPRSSQSQHCLPQQCPACPPQHCLPPAAAGGGGGGAAQVFPGEPSAALPGSQNYEQPASVLAGYADRAQHHDVPVSACLPAPAAARSWCPACLQRGASRLEAWCGCGSLGR